MQHPHSDGHLTTPPSSSLPLYLVGFSSLAFAHFLGDLLGFAFSLSDARF